MSDKTIYQLTELENVSQDDELIIYDVSDTTETPTKKVKVKNFLNNSYSTEEHPTGKKWIDGKPIYRKVVKNLSFGGTVGSWDNTGATITNVSKLIKVDAIKSNEGPVNFMNFGMSGNNLQYVTYHNWTGTDTVIVEYTKTTD